MMALVLTLLLALLALGAWWMIHAWLDWLALTDRMLAYRARFRAVYPRVEPETNSTNGACDGL